MAPSARRLLTFGAQAATAPLRVPVALGAALVEPVRVDIRRGVRRSLGLRGAPPPRVDDPTVAFLPPGGMARRVHGDLPAMVVGGLAALLLQTLHPLAMAGVADHSAYEDDPIGRLRRTAAFVGTTTFGSRAQALAAIEEVRTVHRRVRGRAPDGRAYSANDPDLLTWVHVAEVYSFCEAADRYGPRRLSQPERDRYYAETAAVAEALGARWAPRSADEVTAYFLRMRPELYAGPQALAARDFLLRGVGRRPNDRAVYAMIAGGALTVLPPWARGALGIPVVPVADALVVAPAARALCTALRWAVAGPEAAPATPPADRARPGPPSPRRPAPEPALRQLDADPVTRVQTG